MSLFAFLVVMLSGTMVGISQKVDSFAYNATVLTGTLRDATMSLYGALDPARRRQSLHKAMDLWTLMCSFVFGAVCGGVLGRHAGNHALWLPIAVLGIVFTLVARSGSRAAGFDEGHRT